MRRGVFVQHFFDTSDGKDIAVNGTATVYTKAMKVKYFQAGSLVYQATGSSPNVQIDIEQSDSEDSGFVTPEGMSSFDTVTDESAHRKPMDIDVSTYLRLKLTGGAGNGADTTIALSVSQLEEQV